MLFDEILEVVAEIDFSIECAENLISVSNEIGGNSDNLIDLLTDLVVKHADELEEIGFPLMSAAISALVEHASIEYQREKKNKPTHLSDVVREVL